jgi:hypothetical protein
MSNENAELVALRLQVRTLQQALKQSQEMIALALGKIPEAERISFYDMVVKHMAERGIQKADQYETIIQTTLLGLNQVAQQTADAQAKQRLVEIIKALTIAIESDRPKEST